MGFSYMKQKMILFKNSPSLYVNRTSPSSNISSPLEKIVSRFKIKPQAPNPLISRASLTGLHVVSAVISGTRRFYHPNLNSQTLRTLMRRAFVMVAKQSLAKRLLWSSARKWTAGGVMVTTVLLGSGLCFLMFGGKIERVPYSKRFHYALSYKLEKKLSEIQWQVLEEENREKILPQSDPRVVRVQSIARKILEAMNNGLMLQHQHQIIAQTSETSRLLNNNDIEPNFSAGREDFVVNMDHEVIQGSRNHTQKHLWKPTTKHLDGKVWEVYVTNSNEKNARCILDGKIFIHDGVLRSFKSDAELATVIGHEIGHAVARHQSEGLMRHFVIMFTRYLLLVFGDAEIPRKPFVKLLQLFFSRRMEAEADYIGLMLMASAGYDPQVAPSVCESFDSYSSKTNILRAIYSTHPPGKKRAKLLKKPKTMELAKQIFEEVQFGYGVRNFVR